MIIEGGEEAAAFDRSVVAAVESADRIVLTAHQNVFDVLDDTSGHFIGEDIVVASHELDAAERAALLAKLRRMNRELRISTMCLFSPHHAVVFHTGADVRRIEVCFTCGDIGWGERPSAYPFGLHRVLYDLFTDAGLEPERKWERTVINRRPRKAGDGPALHVDDIVVDKVGTDDSGKR